MEHKKNTKSFASRWGFILASVGSAVGMANVWGFPNKMGSNGGGAFLLIYLLFVFIFSYVGLPAEFAMGRRAATGTLGDHTVVIQVGETEALVDGETRTLDVPAQIIQNRTMVPARFISEAFGCSVTWDGTSQTAAVANRLNGEHIYITPTGKRYHFDGHCNGGTYIETTLADAMGRGLTACQKCAK